MFNKLISKFVLISGLCAIAINGYCGITIVSAEKLNEMFVNKAEKLTIVDVRGGYDFQKGHIPGAVNAPYNIVDEANLPKEGALVLYCGNDKCPLSHLAAKTLETAGYKDIQVLEGGIAAWIAKGFAVETAAGVEKKSEVITIASVRPAKVRKRLTDKTMGIIDARPENEFKIAHLPGAKNIPLEGLAAASADLSKDTEWVVYDRQAGRAGDAARALAAKGFKVKELSGGIQVWSAKKYPLETGQ